MKEEEWPALLYYIYRKLVLWEFDQPDLKRMSNNRWSLSSLTAIIRNYIWIPKYGSWGHSWSASSLILQTNLPILNTTLQTSQLKLNIPPPSTAISLPEHPSPVWLRRSLHFFYCTSCFSLLFSFITLHCTCLFFNCHYIVKSWELDTYSSPSCLQSKWHIIGIQ